MRQKQQQTTANESKVKVENQNKTKQAEKRTAVFHLSSSLLHCMYLPHAVLAFLHGEFSKSCLGGCLDFCVFRCSYFVPPGDNKVC